MVSGPQHETTQGRPATAIRIRVVLCGAPGVRTKILATKKKGPGCKQRSRSHGESGEVFSLDILSHRIERIETTVSVPITLAGFFGERETRKSTLESILGRSGEAFWRRNHRRQNCAPR